MASRTTHPASAIPKRRRRNLNNGQHGAESSSKSAEASAESNDETDVGGNLDDDASSINGPAATASSYHQHGGSGIGGGALRNRDSFEETSIPFSSSSDSIGSQPHPSSAFAAGLGRKRLNALLPLVGASASLMTSRVDENDGSSVTMESPEGYNSGGHESSGTYDGDISSTAVGGLDRKAGGGHHHHRIGHHTHTESEASMTSAIPGLAPSSKGAAPVVASSFDSPVSSPMPSPIPSALPAHMRTPNSHVYHPNLPTSLAQVQTQAQPQGFLRPQPVPHIGSAQSSASQIGTISNSTSSAHANVLSQPTAATSQAATSHAYGGDGGGRGDKSPTPTHWAAAPHGYLANMSAEEIQKNVRDAIEGKTEEGTGYKRSYKINEPPADRPVRIYADGVYDLFHFGHALQLRQAKLTFPSTYLMVGVCSDELVRKYKASPVMTSAERYESVRNCRWVDEVVEDAPWVIDQEFVDKHQIDYVAHDEEPYVGIGSDDIYAFVKKQGKFIPTRRTAGVSTSEILQRIVEGYREGFYDNKLEKIGHPELCSRANSDGSGWVPSRTSSAAGLRESVILEREEGARSAGKDSDEVMKDA